jgi:hypothetical protein
MIAISKQLNRTVQSILLLYFVLCLFASYYTQIIDFAFNASLCGAAISLVFVKTQ